MLDSLLESLIGIGLLKEFQKGVITGTKRSNLFIKSLPITETLNTTNRFTLDLLDRINLPWRMYRSKCTILSKPSNTSVFSDEVNQYLQGGIYQK
jgi:hypothetical protein